MRTQGTVVRWDDARGFGFIRSPQGTQDVYFHARDFAASPDQRPRIGLDVAFEQIQVGGKGPRAMAVRPAGAGGPVSTRLRTAAARREPARRAADGSGRGSGWLALPLMLAYAGALAWGVRSGALPAWVLAASPGANLVAFFAYWKDKYAAEQGKWRTREADLHLFSLAGGWGGAWFAQLLLRHKSRKASFLRMYWLTVAVHCGALGCWLHFAGR